MVNWMPWWLSATLQIMVSILNGCNNDIDHRADGTNAYPPTTVQWLEDAMERASQECPGKRLKPSIHTTTNQSHLSPLLPPVNGNWIFSILVATKKV